MASAKVKAVLNLASMKLSEKFNARLGRFLLWGVPLLMTIPNIALCAYGHLSPCAVLANILLPWGLAGLFVAIRGRVGLNSLLMLPLMVLAAFQIVLLFLYADGSIIGVDMFLNVATTNSSEARELLENLRPAIAVVIFLYLPPLAAGVIAMRRKVRPDVRNIRLSRLCGMIAAVVGSVALGLCVAFQPTYHVDEDLYPVNVICNLGDAFCRSHASANYPTTCSDYRFGATTARPDSVRELYVAVIGETSRADNWQLFGYGRFTTPQLCSVSSNAGFISFAAAFSESNTTHKAVPLLLSTLDVESFADSINCVKSVITAFKEAGFRTDVVSMQCRNGSYIDYFLAEADSTVYLREPEPGYVRTDIYDVDLLLSVDSIVARGAQKQLIVLHQYGSHFNYADRYPRSEAYFLPDKTAEAKASNRGQLVNAYDNALRQTDCLLAGLIDRLDSVGCMGGLIYTSDHGEDIFDDARNRFLHASPTPTYFQLHVPMLVYMNGEFRAAQPDMAVNARANCMKPVSSSSGYTPTLMHMAGLRSHRLDETRALTSERYETDSEHLFLSDRNRPETLHEAGFGSEDFARLTRLREGR